MCVRLVYLCACACACVYASVCEAFGTCHALRMAANRCMKTDCGQTSAAAKPVLYPWIVATHAHKRKESRTIEKRAAAAARASSGIE